MIRTFDQLFKEVIKQPKQTLVVPAAENSAIISACAEAAARKICQVILIGDEEKIRHIASEEKQDIRWFEVLNEPDSDQAVGRAIQLVHEGRASMIMKGITDTPTLLKAVLDGDTGLRAGRILSHVAVVEMAAYSRLMLVSDGGLNIRPDFDTRKDIIRNAVEVAAKLGFPFPNVALLSAMEKVNPKMPETLEYQATVADQEHNPFVTATIEGPMAMDIALSSKAAEIKGVTSKIAGKTDIFIVPEISTANIFVKALIYLGEAKVGGLIVGAKVPIVLLSRADDAETKLRSIALGALWT